MGLWDVCDELRGKRWVELSHELTNDSPSWSGIPAGSVDLARTVYDWGSPELECLIQTFKFPGQFGTHVDFPGHFEKGAALSEEFGVRQFVWPLVVLDVSGKVAENPDYEVTLDDVRKHEERYGRIPAGSFVALRTDWHTRWPDNDALNNFDEQGNEHAPGWTVPVLEFLYETRGIAASGHETIDTDASVGAGRACDLVAERYVLSHGHLQIELLDNLDQVPAVGSVMFAAVPRIAGATGLPARVWAVVDEPAE